MKHEFTQQYSYSESPKSHDESCINSVIKEGSKQFTYLVI